MDGVRVRELPALFQTAKITQGVGGTSPLREQELPPRKSFLDDEGLVLPSGTSPDRYRGDGLYPRAEFGVGVSPAL